MPYLLIIYQGKGIANDLVFWIEAAYYLIVFLAEIPSGILGDRYSHARIAKIGLVLTVIGYLSLFVSPDFLTVLVSQVILALGASLISGSDEALIYAHLSKRYTSSQVYTFQRKGYAYLTSGTLVAYFLAGLLIQSGMSVAYLLVLTAMTYMMAYVSISRIRSDKQAQSKVFQWQPLRQHLGLVSLVGVLLAVLGNLYWFIQIYYQELGLSPLLISICFMSLTVMTIVLTRVKQVKNDSSSFLWLW